MYTIGNIVEMRFKFSNNENFVKNDFVKHSVKMSPLSIKLRTHMRNLSN